MSQLFVEALHDTNGAVLGGYVGKIEAIELANDDVTHKLFIELGRNFITPFDREDIHYLITDLDNVADYMWANIKLMKNYGITYAGRTAQQFSDDCRKMVKLIAASILQLKNKKELPLLAKNCREIKQVIHSSKANLDTAMTALYEQDMDTISLIKKIDHYEMLQTLLRKCSNVTNTIESIIIKYG